MLIIFSVFVKIRWFCATSGERRAGPQRPRHLQSLTAENLEQLNAIGDNIQCGNHIPWVTYLEMTYSLKLESKNHTWYANRVYLSAIWENTALVQWIRCELLGEHLIYWTCAVFSHIARKINNICIYSHNDVTHDIKQHTSCWISSYSAIWADTNIRLIVKTKAQSVRNLYKVRYIKSIDIIDSLFKRLWQPKDNSDFRHFVTSFSSVSLFSLWHTQLLYGTIHVFKVVWHQNDKLFYYLFWSDKCSNTISCVVIYSCRKCTKVIISVKWMKTRDMSIESSGLHIFFVVFQQPQNICVTFKQCWRNAENVGLSL